MPELGPRDARIAELEAKVAWLMDRVAMLEAENAEVGRLRAENQELRAQLEKNSQNSSKPPSSDPLWFPRTPELRLAELGVSSLRRRDRRDPTHGLQREGKAGDADARLSRPRDVVAVAVKHLAANPLVFLRAASATCAEADLARGSVGARRA